jgi:oligoendopeptidase F
MSINKNVLKRSDIDENETWAMEDLFSSDEAWEEEYTKLEAKICDYEQFKGHLSENAETLYRCLELNYSIEECFENVYVYARQKFDEDTNVSLYQGYVGKAEMLAVKIASVSSYIIPELLEMSNEDIKEFMQKEPKLLHYKRFFEIIERKRKHTLSADLEAMLADMGEVSSTASKVFSMFNNADLKLPDIKDEMGENVKLTQGKYVKFLENSNRNVRKSAFEGMLGTYNDYRNMLAATFEGNIKKAAFYAKTKKYKSSRAYYLSDSNIPEAVYDNLIDTVHEALPIFHRYMKLRKRLLGYDKLHMYDLYVPLVNGMDKNITYDEAKNMVREGLKPLGEEYLTILEEGFNSRWIDVRENIGKRTGAYSFGAYGTHPYVLLNYQDNLNNVFTLAHEMGHAIHSYYSDKKQPYIYAGYKIFVAEVASTCNESLLIQDLINKCETKKEKAYIINDFLEKFRGTLFRQTMFAEFERDMHRAFEAGQPLVADKLCEEYYKLNKCYFGDDVEIDKLIEMEWARIPHFYNSFYVYQYATGFSAAIALSKKILSEGESAVNDYKEFLSGGNSKDSIDLLKIAGVDMSQKEPIEQAIKLFEELLEELERITD